MNIMGTTIADKILTGILSTQAMAVVPVPAAWITAGLDLLSIDLWSASSFTLEGGAGQTAVTVAANQVVTIACRFDLAKSTVAFPFLIANAADVNMLGHAITHAYADQG